MARVVSVEPFQATTMVSPKVAGGVGGATRIGPALEQRRLERDHARVVGVRARPPDDRDVEDAAVAADEAVALELRLEPPVRRAAPLDALARDAVRLHGALELPARAGRHLLPGFLVEDRRHADDDVDRHHVGDVGPDGEAFDVGLEAPGEEHGGIGDGLEEDVLLDRDEDVLHGRTLDSNAAGSGEPDGIIHQSMPRQDGAACGE
jgi:hypothetical protein